MRLRQFVGRAGKCRLANERAAGEAKGAAGRQACSWQRCSWQRGGCWQGRGRQSEGRGRQGSRPAEGRGRQRGRGRRRCGWQTGPQLAKVRLAQGCSGQWAAASRGGRGRQWGAAAGSGARPAEGRGRQGSRPAEGSRSAEVRLAEGRAPDARGCAGVQCCTQGRQRHRAGSKGAWAHGNTVCASEGRSRQAERTCRNMHPFDRDTLVRLGFLRVVWCCAQRAQRHRAGTKGVSAFCSTVCRVCAQQAARACWGPRPRRPDLLAIVDGVRWRTHSHMQRATGGSGRYSFGPDGRLQQAAASLCSGASTFWGAQTQPVAPAPQRPDSKPVPANALERGQFI